MPTYQYRCKQCGHELEIVQSFSDAPLDTCPECQGALKKVYGNVGISFKGSGFYKTDSRGGSSSTKAEKTDKATTSSDGGSSTATKTDSTGSGDKAANPSSAATSSTASTSTTKSD